MGRELGPDYYDQRIERAMIPLEESPWREVYRSVVSLLPLHGQDLPIADLGCGTGRLARLLYERGYRQYWGVDFSPRRVAEARRYLPQFTFEVGDVYDCKVQEKLRGFRIFLMIELLEHLERDLEVISCVPPGGLVVMSCPSFDSAGHVRFFGSADELKGRYRHLLEFHDAAGITVPMKKEGRMIFTLRATRSGMSV